jgi:hypothetical protein
MCIKKPTLFRSSEEDLVSEILVERMRASGGDMTHKGKEQKP